MTKATSLRIGFALLVALAVGGGGAQVAYANIDPWAYCTAKHPSETTSATRSTMYFSWLYRPSGSSQHFAKRFASYVKARYGVQVKASCTSSFWTKRDAAESLTGNRRAARFWGVHVVDTQWTP